MFCALALQPALYEKGHMENPEKGGRGCGELIPLTVGNGKGKQIGCTKDLIAKNVESERN